MYKGPSYSYVIFLWPNSQHLAQSILPIFIFAQVGGDPQVFEKSHQECGYAEKNWHVWPLCLHEAALDRKGFVPELRGHFPHLTVSTWCSWYHPDVGSGFQMLLPSSTSPGIKCPCVHKTRHMFAYMCKYMQIYAMMVFKCVKKLQCRQDGCVWSY